MALLHGGVTVRGNCRPSRKLPPMGTTLLSSEEEISEDESCEPPLPPL